MGAQEAPSWLLKLWEEKPWEQGAHGRHVHRRVWVGDEHGDIQCTALPCQLFPPEQTWGWKCHAS